MSKAENNNQSNSTARKRKIILLCSLILFVAIIMLLAFFISKPLINSITSPEGRLEFKEWISSLGFVGKLIVIGLMALQLILAVIPGGPVQIVTGITYGVVEGTILCELGIILGSTIVFFTVRKLGRKFIYLFIKEEDIEKISFLQDEQKLNLISFVLMVIPGAPKDALTYFLGLTKMKYYVFIMISVIGRLPALIMSTMTGNSVLEGNWITALIIAISVGFVFIVGILIYGYIVKKHNKAKKLKQENSPKPDEND